MTKEDSIYVELKDLLFTETLLNFECQQNLRKFSNKGLIECQEEIARNLHGDGGATALLAARSNEL